MPRWLAPFLGCGIAFVLAYRLVRSGEQDLSFAVIFAVLGLLAGGLVMIADRSVSVRESELEGSPIRDPEYTTIARVIALLSVVTAILPFIGVFIGLADVVVNFRRGGWPRIVSWIGLSLTVGLHALALALAPPK